MKFKCFKSFKCFNPLKLSAGTKFDNSFIQATESLGGLDRQLAVKCFLNFKISFVKSLKRFNPPKLSGGSELGNSFKVIERVGV